MLDQARILAKSAYRTVMILPLAGFATSQGVATGLKRLADIASMPFTLNIKSENFVDVDTLAALIGDGTLLAVKHAIVGADPTNKAHSHVAKAGESAEAQRMHERFLPLETLRDDISLIRVRHDAVTLSRIAENSPILPLMSGTPESGIGACLARIRTHHRPSKPGNTRKTG